MSRRRFFGVVAACLHRALLRIVRRPDVIVATVVFPVLLLLTLHAVFSVAVESFEDGESYGQRLVPTLVFSGVMFGSIGTATGMFLDMESGWMDRLRSMPIHPAAPLVGTVLAEAVRALLAVFVLVSVGYLFDFRFDNGLFAAIGFVIVAAVASMTIAWVGLVLAVGAKSQEGLIGPLNAVFLLLLFLSRGMVPLEAYPGWVQPVVRANPATAYVTLLDRLARGGELVQPALIASAWTIGITVVFAGLAVRRLTPNTTHSAGLPTAVR